MQSFDESKFFFGVYNTNWARYEGMLDLLTGGPKGFGRLTDNDRKFF